MEGASRFDDRAKYALGVSRDSGGIDAVTLCEHRTRVIESGIILSLFSNLLADARAKDLISCDKLQIVDSFMVYGAGAAQDTYTLLRKGIVQVLKVAGFDELNSELASVLSRQDYATDAKPKINWDDPEEKRLLLESYVIDARNLVAAVRALGSPSRDLKDEADLLESIAEQDIDAEDGRIKMKRGIAKDRIISVRDPDMRHGHKTSLFKVNRCTSYIMTDGTFVTSVVVTPANKVDSEPFSDVMDQCRENGIEFTEVVGDSAYCKWPIIEKKAKMELK